MNGYIPIASFLLIATWMIAIWIVWIAGTRHPSPEIASKIGLDAIRDHLSKWYTNGTWVCVEVIDDYPGFMGVPTRVIIVQRNRERFRFQCSDNGIATGSVVKLALRTDKGCRTGVWLSAVDRYMYPVPSMSMTGHAGN